MRAVFLDVEATGLDIYKHHILEIAFKIMDVSTGRELYSYQRVIKQPWEIWEKRDLHSIEINGFTWERVLEGSEKQEVKDEIIQIFNSNEIVRERAFYICQNPAFDRSFFSQLIDPYLQEKYLWPYHWLDFASMYWALQVQEWISQKKSFPKEINLSKNEIAQKFHLPIEDYPHSAMQGVEHLILCYKTVVGPV